jgi:hypothetical protein
MPGKRVLPEQKLDYHINFTLQHAAGQRFAEQCRKENVTVQEKLRYLVDEYIKWVDDTGR